MNIEDALQEIGVLKLRLSRSQEIAFRALMSGPKTSWELREAAHIGNVSEMARQINSALARSGDGRRVQTDRVKGKGQEFLWAINPASSQSQPPTSGTSR